MVICESSTLQPWAYMGKLVYMTFESDESDDKGSLLKPAQMKSTFHYLPSNVTRERYFHGYEERARTCLCYHAVIFCVPQVRPTIVAVPFERVAM
jgi:hypothetical protein